ncbi:MAG: fasciclin domain-containing protein, partial [Prolixibacteraceae bacterium]|nr:fasciclin domain-containing protein [Prolixibacteraceae bacterium]
ALNDRTLSGERLVANFYTDGDNQLIKINNIAPIIQSNLEMTNGYIHIVSEVVHQAEISGYDWIQQKEGYSIFAKAMELSGINERLKWSRFTILAEHDSIYRKAGINNIDDLIKLVASPGTPISNRANSFYQFVAFHIFSGEFYLNDLYWGSSEYWTYANRSVTINVGAEIKINQGVDTYGFSVSESGDSTEIDYIRMLWDDCNIMTSTGPFHSISDVLYFKPLPKNQ